MKKRKVKFKPLIQQRLFLNTITRLQFFNGGFCLTCSIHSQINCSCSTENRSSIKSTAQHSVKYHTTSVNFITTNKWGKPKAASTEAQNLQRKSSPTPSSFIVNLSSSPQCKCDRQLLLLSQHPSTHTEREGKNA